MIETLQYLHYYTYLHVKKKSVPSEARFGTFSTLSPHPPCTVPTACQRTRVRKIHHSSRENSKDVMILWLKIPHVINNKKYKQMNPWSPSVLDGYQVSETIWNILPVLIYAVPSWRCYSRNEQQLALPGIHSRQWNIRPKKQRVHWTAWYFHGRVSNIIHTYLNHQRHPQTSVECGTQWPGMQPMGLWVQDRSETVLTPQWR